MGRYISVFIFVVHHWTDVIFPDITSGFTEGDRWVYSFALLHDIPGVIEHRGGNASFVRSLEEFFDGGWIDFTNEVPIVLSITLFFFNHQIPQPAHHTPYLYALAGAPSYTQERVREMARMNYHNTPNGLTGVCGSFSSKWL